MCGFAQNYAHTGTKKRAVNHRLFTPSGDRRFPYPGRAALVAPDNAGSSFLRPGDAVFYLTRDETTAGIGFAADPGDSRTVYNQARKFNLARSSSEGLAVNLLTMTMLANERMKLGSSSYR